MIEFPTSVFEAAAEAVVPTLRQILADAGQNESTTQMTFGITDDIEIDGVTSRVRIEVILSPDEETETENDEDA